MNKKSILKMGLLMLIGAVIGGVSSFALFFLKDEFGNFYLTLVDFIVKISPFLYPTIFIVMYLPALYLASKGKKYILEARKADDDHVDELERKSEQYLQPAMTLNSIFMLTNFLLIGTTLVKGTSYYFIVLFVFLFNTIMASGFEIVIVKFIQKHDERLKGDPTSLNFHKEYVASLDEAEQLRTYKAGYESFQFSRNITFAMLILMILFNMIFEVGAMPIIVAVLIGFSQVISFAVYSYKNLNNTI